MKTKNTSPFLPWRWPLHWQILLALLLGLTAGLSLGHYHAAVSTFGFLGDFFLRALKMVIVPLLAGSIITGVSGMGAAGSLGRLFRRTFSWYVLTSLLAILTGLLLVNVIQPGLVEHMMDGLRKAGLDIPPAATDIDGA